MSALAERAWVRGLLRLHWLMQRFSRGRAGLYIYLLCAQPLGGPAAAATRPDPNTRIRAVAPGDAETRAFKRPPAVLDERFAAGTRCYAATVKGEFAGHIWLASGHYDEDEVRCRYVLPKVPASVWDFDVYVEPAYRLSRVLSRLWAAVDRQLASEGIRWSFSRISLYSRRSVQSHERLGARQVGYAAFLVLGPVQVCLHSGRARLHLGFRRRSAPVIELKAPGA